MKLYLGILISALTFTACQNNSGQQNQANSDNQADVANSENYVLESKQYCFFLAEGSDIQDSTKVSFSIDGNRVTGDMQWIPYEKDSRVGTLKGEVDGEQIHVVWTYMQEGMQDTLSLKFKLAPNNLLTQKPLKLNIDNGREETDDSSDYSINYTATDCK